MHVWSEVSIHRAETPQVDLPLATEGVLRYVWESQFGSMLIEVKDGKSYVNGQLVEPAQSQAVLQASHSLRP